jgi:dTDP-4-amino-4,6-dideoxygalactose transaminase
MYIGKWYRPLFFPGVKDYSAYNYRVGSCPVAEDVSARIVNLPTDLNTTAKVAKEIADALIN